ncbi:hypothetical protein DSO57_1022160 [Entomophthora muscae]|uniref:Uncharacterized protein n=1 Tax=Entomophthora muscae TaxID=34485 RepID=A0ACC2RI00_9FUNG|nr:hypothetical protein DSO57_1022160 [Entomophthora muscae]
MIYTFFFKSHQPWIMTVTYWSFSSRGILHLIAFLADPVVFKIIPNLFNSRFKYREGTTLTPRDQLFDKDITFEFFATKSKIDSTSLKLKERLSKDFQQFI